MSAAASKKLMNDVHQAELKNLNKEKVVTASEVIQ